jgi:Ni/Fe-hydrogenase subunit HybB-like protein
MKCKNSSAFTLAAVLALLGVLAEKLWVLIAGLEHPLVAIPGRAAYHLSAAELLAVIGTAGLGVLAYVVILGLFSRDAVHQSDSMDLTQ